MNVESNLKLDFEGANTPMGPNEPHSELMYHDGMIYKGWIGSWFILMRKAILEII